MALAPAHEWKRAVEEICKFLGKPVGAKSSSSYRYLEFMVASIPNVN
jgi:hypothetical protein